MEKGRRKNGGEEEKQDREEGKLRTKKHYEIERVFPLRLSIPRLPQSLSCICTTGSGLVVQVSSLPFDFYYFYSLYSSFCSVDLLTTYPSSPPPPSRPEEHRQVRLLVFYSKRLSRDACPPIGTLIVRGLTM